MSFFTVQNITAGYGKKHVIKDISFELNKGCLLGIIGANGSGKTTLLKVICGILPHKGDCRLDGEILEQMSPRQIARVCSYIPQRSGINIDISVLDVVLMGFNPYLGILEQPNTSMRAIAIQTIAQVGLAGMENTNYLHLSEGQKQLCIFARMLVAENKLLLLDEPESALDFRYRYRILENLRQRVVSTQSVAIAALHDPALALNYCDKLLLMANGEVIGMIAPKSDSIDEMEKLLGNIYGSISLKQYVTRCGKTQLLMLKEDDF